MQEIVKLKKEIEIFKFRTKLLLQEKDRKSAQLRQLKNKYTTLLDTNEETGKLTSCILQIIIIECSRL